jgi:hypothetical protein
VIGESGCDRKALLGEQRADGLLRRRVVALARVHLAQVPAPVDQVLLRPVLVPEHVPRQELVVDRDRILHVQPADGVLDIRDDVLERELGRVDADDDEAVLPVARVPRLEVRKRAQAVDARVCPEVDEDDLAAERAHRQRAPVRRVQPLRDA